MNKIPKINFWFIAFSDIRRRRLVKILKKETSNRITFGP